MTRPVYKLALLHFISVALILSTSLSHGQVSPPSAYNGSEKVNYIRTWLVTAPDKNATKVMGRALKDAKQSTQYLDGLGRPLQTVIKKGSLKTGDTAIDLVTAIVYDQFGRQTYQYLPFAANNTGSNTHVSDGLFKANPFQQQATFMQSQYGTQNQTFFYNQTIYESSPLNRIDKTLPAGNSWVGAGRGITVKQWVNTITDSVRNWRVSNVSNNWGTYSTTNMYSAGDLLKTVSEDEHSKQTIEFIDKEGKIILKKVQLTSTADTGNGKGYAGWICTYYIYDSLNNLRCAVQPRGVELLSQNSWNINAFSGAILGEQTFRYEYDQQNRIIRKKVPGRAEERMVYDSRDRLVMTQDGNLRLQKKWMYMVYDDLNRPVATGLLLDPTNYNNLLYHLQQAYGSVAYPNLLSYSTDELTRIFYDDYSWLTSYGNPFGSNRSTSDDAEFFTPSNTTPPYGQPLTQNTITKGLVTGSRIKVLGSATYLYSINFYDMENRLNQTQTQNISGGMDVESHQYSFDGNELITVFRHQKSGTGAQNHTIVTWRAYDDLGRLKQVQKKVIASIAGLTIPTYWRTVADYEYDALGNLKAKKLSPSLNLETLTNEYNIRGWLLGMNRAYVKDTSSTANFFGFDLGYDKDTIVINGTNKFYSDKQYNSNVAGILWKSTGDDRTRKYDFTYDAANRFTNANFTQLTNNSFNLNAGIDYSVRGISYDANGNIQTLNQKGWKSGGSDLVDSLLYTYNDYSSLLKNVWDKKNDTATRLGDFRSSKAYMTDLSNNKTTGATDYTYDSNSNVVRDLNKDIKRGTSNGISYNHLNLPDTIWINAKGRIVYTYNAIGQKLKKTVTDSTINPVKTITTLFIAGIEYSNDTLQQISFEEGRIRFNKADTTLKYDYFIRDHLGNVRMVLTEEQQLNVYPEVTFEDATVGNEQIYYDSVDQERTARPGSFFSAGTNGNKVQLLRKNTQPIGSGKLLKVMATDRLHVKVDYYAPNDPTDNNNANGLNSVLATLTSMLNAVTAPSLLKGSGSLIANQLDNPGAFVDFLSPQGSGITSSMPKAYLNILFFDEQFNFVQENSEIVQITTKGSGQQIFRVSGNAKVAAKNGYVYIYVSNESNNLVYFDNLQISHERGAILEEAHYYPYGLTMAGISSKALKSNYAENKFKYNGIEYESCFDLNIGETLFRSHDPQLGRWWQPDPKPNYSQSMYESMSNNPLRFVDFLGDTAIIFGSNGKFLRFQDDGKKYWTGKMIVGSTSKVTVAKNGDVTVTAKVRYRSFKLNDPELVVKAIRNGVINKVEFITDTKIETQIARSGVKSPEAQTRPYNFALNSSTAGHSMDFAIQGDRNHDLNKNTLYVTGGLGYDIADFGNFLWGRAMGELGIPMPLPNIGANYNHIKNARQGNDKTSLFDLGPGTYGSPGLLDASSDQLAITNGYWSSPGVIQRARDSQKDFNRVMKNYIPYWNH